MSGIPRPGADANSMRRSINVMRDRVVALEARPVSAPLTDEQFAALAAATEAAASSSTTTTTATAEATTEQGSFAFDGVTYMYNSFGVDGDWEARRFGKSGENSTGPNQSGTKPTTLSAFQVLSYPDPA